MVVRIENADFGQTLCEYVAYGKGTAHIMDATLCLLVLPCRTKAPTPQWLVGVCDLLRDSQLSPSSEELTSAQMELPHPRIHCSHWAVTIKVKAQANF